MVFELPDEIVLQFFARLPLTGLIRCRCVYQQWRRLIFENTDILLARRVVLELYYEVISPPFFLETREWVLENLRPYNRKAYIECKIRGIFPKNS